jgi:ankyrin repeat protein
VDRDTVRALLSKDAKFDSKASGGTTVLWHTAVRGDRETADVLLHHGAKVDVSLLGQTPCCGKRSVRETRQWSSS